MTNILYQGFFVTVCAGTAYRHLFSKVKKKVICNVYYYRISDFRLVSTGTYYLVPAPIFVQKSPDYTCTCIAKSLRSVSYKHPFGVLLSPKSLIISSKFQDSNTSDSMLMAIILAAYCCKLKARC